MILFTTGIRITQNEHAALLHVEDDPETWLRQVIADKVLARTDALIQEWRPRLLADPNISSLPANRQALVALIMEQPSYTSRHQQELANPDSAINNKAYSRTVGFKDSGANPNIARFDARQTQTQQMVTLFPNGLDIQDNDCNCVHAYVDSFEDWIIGALLGQIHRGKKKMIRQYQQVLFDDPDVVTIPATEEGLIDMIVKRPDYETIPQQIK